MYYFNTPTTLQSNHNLDHNLGVVGNASSTGSNGDPAVDLALLQLFLLIVHHILRHLFAHGPAERHSKAWLKLAGGDGSVSWWTTQSPVVMGHSLTGLGLLATAFDSCSLSGQLVNRFYWVSCHLMPLAQLIRTTSQYLLLLDSCPSNYCHPVESIGDSNWGLGN